LNHWISLFKSELVSKDISFGDGAPMDGNRGLVSVLGVSGILADIMVSYSRISVSRKDAPMYPSNHIEYAISTGHIHIVTENGKRIPAYWSHPDIGGKFPGIALIHDWWGITDIERRLAHQFAQLGYYIIIPDLFDGQTAASPHEALVLVEALGAAGYPYVNTALQAVEQHHRCNGKVAAIGLGMGGSLAYEASIVRTDLEASIAYYGFPQRYLGRFKDSKAPILAFYGTQEPFVSPKTIERFRADIAQSPLPHEVAMIDGAGHDFFSDNAQQYTKAVWDKTLAFLEKQLQHPAKPPQKPKVV
jgi:carboxymethylenebutenolidase